MDAAKADARARKSRDGGEGGKLVEGTHPMSGESSTSGGENAYLFLHVASLVHKLGRADACRVICGCARKTDPTHWPRLFTVCGQPYDLLHTSLAAGLPDCASALLLPLRHASGSAACAQAVQLVRSAAEARGETNLLCQLDAFAQRLVLDDD